MNARDASELHSKLRLTQRHGVRMSREQLREVVQRIQTGQAIPLKKLTRSRTLFAVEGGRDGTLVPVVYSSARKAIVTALPETVLTRYEAKLSAAMFQRGIRERSDEPSRFEEDPQIARFKLVDNDPSMKLKLYVYFKETTAGRKIAYLESNKVCAAGRSDACKLLERQLESSFDHRPAEVRTQLVQRFINRFERGLDAVGLSWESEEGDEGPHVTQDLPTSG